MQRFLLACLSALLATSLPAADGPTLLQLWPGAAPGETKPLPEEKDMTKASDGLIAGKPVIRLGNVSQPTLTVFRPPPDKDTGAAVLVCPGGGYHILALDLEGTEVCTWLNRIGVTGILLKYRVPRREGLEKHTAPLQDAQRAMGLVRERAHLWGIDPHRIGVLGFSAGGHLAASLSTHDGPRTYPPQDEADALDCRPNFAVLVYPGYLALKETPGQLAPDLKITTNTPPTFLVMTQDDPVGVENALVYAAELANAKVPMELHIYPKGGHGYGLRPTQDPVTSWPARVEDWMRSRGLIR